MLVRMRMRMRESRNYGAYWRDHMEAPLLGGTRRASVPPSLTTFNSCLVKLHFIEHCITLRDVLHSSCTKPGIGLLPDPPAVRWKVWLNETIPDFACNKHGVKGRDVTCT